MPPAVVRYREYAPCAALRDSVRAFFSFAEPATDDVPSRGILCEIPFRRGDLFCSPMFADGHASLVFNFARVCRADGVWQSSPVVPHADLIGPSTAVGPSSLAARAEAVGVYFRAGMVSQFIRISGADMQNRVADADSLWGAQALSLAEDLSERGREGARIDLWVAKTGPDVNSTACTCRPIAETGALRRVTTVDPWLDSSSPCLPQ
jgi:hypothetical protein